MQRCLTTIRPPCRQTPTPATRSCPSGRASSLRCSGRRTGTASTGGRRAPGPASCPATWCRRCRWAAPPPGRSLVAAHFPRRLTALHPAPAPPLKHLPCCSSTGTSTPAHQHLHQHLRGSFGCGNWVRCGAWSLQWCRPRCRLTGHRPPATGHRPPPPHTGHCPTLHTHTQMEV